MLTRKIQDNTMYFYDGQELILTIIEEETENGVHMRLKGQLRSDTTHHLQDELDAFTTVSVRVVLDFQEVTYIAYSVMYALLSCQVRVDNMQQGEILLRNIPEAIYREMSDAHILDMLLIEEQEEKLV